MTQQASEISIRPLAAADYGAVCAVWQAAGIEAKLTGRDALEPFVKQLECYPTTYLGAEAAGLLVGVVMGTHDGRKGWINRVAVHPDWQRRGIGRMLMQACEEALRDCGIEIISALIEQGNETSRRLFEHCGYVDDVAVHYYRKRARPDI